MGIWQTLWQRMRHCLLRATDRQASKTFEEPDGARAETLAADFLRERGVRILARNVRCKGGEIDIIGEQAGTLLFCEVRLRQDHRFGGAAASITTTKQARIRHAAAVWLHGAGRRHARQVMRFDALLLPDLDPASIEWIQDAFSAG